MRLGQQVKKLRKSLKLTQKEFARGIPGGVDHTYIGKIEQGRLPSIKLLKRIAKTYGVPVGYFFLQETPAKVISLNVKEDVRRWMVQKLLIFEEELREEVEKAIEGALRKARGSEGDREREK